MKGHLEQDQFKKPLLDFLNTNINIQLVKDIERRVIRSILMFMSHVLGRECPSRFLSLD